MIQIREFEETQRDYEALAHITNTVWGKPTYNIDDLRHRDEGRPPHCVHHRFLAEMGSRIVGYGSFEHNPKFYHPQRFWMHLDVLPEKRHQGIGRQLYNHMLTILKSEYKANELHAITTESRDYSIRFLHQYGFQQSKRDPKSRLNVANFDGGRFQKLDAKIATMGIKFKVLSDLMQEDATTLRKVYELHQGLINDVPEPAEHTRVSFASWREGYSSSNPYFIPEANFMALYDTDYIGLTSLWSGASSSKLYTGMTGVKQSYRRKGIATMLKLQAIRYAQAQSTDFIMTSNNSENPMYQLNLMLGFQPYDVEIKLVKKIKH